MGFVRRKKITKQNHEAYYVPRPTVTHISSHITRASEGEKDVLSDETSFS